MTEDTDRSAPGDAALIATVRAQLARYRALTGRGPDDQAGVYLRGGDLARLADLAAEALTLRQSAADRTSLADAAETYGAALIAEEEAREALALSPYREETLARLNEAWLATWEPKETAHAAFRAAYAAHVAARQGGE